MNEPVHECERDPQQALETVGERDCGSNEVGHCRFLGATFLNRAPSYENDNG